MYGRGPGDLDCFSLCVCGELDPVLECAWVTQFCFVHFSFCPQDHQVSVDVFLGGS